VCVIIIGSSLFIRFRANPSLCHLLTCLSINNTKYIIKMSQILILKLHYIMVSSKSYSYHDELQDTPLITEASESANSLTLLL
jgi:hypothetical protein